MLLAGAKALDDNKMSDAMDVISEQYGDSAKRDKKQLKGILFIALRRGPVWVALRDIVVTLDGAKASASLNAFAMQGKAKIETLGDVIPDQARKFELEIKLMKDDDTWTITAIEGLGAQP